MIPVPTLAFMANTFPGVPTQVQPVLDALNSVAAFYVDEGVFGDTVGTYAMGLIVSHLITINGNGGGGATLSDKIGDLARTQQALPVTDAFSLTSYGLQFLQLAKMNDCSVRFYDGGGCVPPPFSFIATQS